MRQIEVFGLVVPAWPAVAATVLASLGITSLAVALSLQPTLSNFYSSVLLVVDKPFRVGDFIELDSGEQGFVEKIGWRSTEEGILIPYPIRAVNTSQEGAFPVLPADRGAAL